MKPFRSKKYMEYVRGLPCSITGVTGQTDPHHAKGYGFGGMSCKPSDFFIMPLKHDLHQMLHAQGHSWFEDMYNKRQIDCVVKTLRKALQDGVIEEDRLLVDIMAVTNREYRNILEKCFV